MNIPQYRGILKSVSWTIRLSVVSCNPEQRLVIAFSLWKSSGECVLDRIWLTSLPYCRTDSKVWFVASDAIFIFCIQALTPTRLGILISNAPAPFMLLTSGNPLAELITRRRPFILTELGRSSLACDGTLILIIGVPPLKL